MRIATQDYHAGGEPFRIVTGGAPPLEGPTVLDRRDWASTHVDDVRRLLVNEPRGHAGMYGCHIVPPDDEEAAFGAVFFHKDGYSLACGHGTIALGAWAVDSGRVEAAPDGETPILIDVPSGRVEARVRTRGGAVTSTVFRNVGAYVGARGLEVATERGPVQADISWGGAAYASVRASHLGLAVTPDDLGDLISVGREIKWALDEHPAARHPRDGRLSGVYGTILWEPLPSPDGELHQRNVAVFADGQVDRSPCGSGTSARMAVLDADGELGDGTVLVHHGIVGTRFRSWIVERAEIHGRVAIITEVEGSAHMTGHHEFVLDPADEVGTGFQLL
ncbi:MAG: proline racemase family protein [Actinomycetota bacterium]